ncbi:MAG: hypothetical protein NC921_03960 [Candidatus Omnitrophica bacterium]|nr:hypothetical protein [Candidatus Omnitrophota bacterium]
MIKLDNIIRLKWVKEDLDELMEVIYQGGDIRKIESRIRVLKENIDEIIEEEKKGKDKKILKYKGIKMLIKINENYIWQVYNYNTGEKICFGVTYYDAIKKAKQKIQKGLDKNKNL